MNNLRLQELHVECFRGATNRAIVHFDASKPLVVVFGENGTGKSTLVDALDLIANTQIGSLMDRSTTSNRHAPAIGRSAKDVKITLIRGAEKWQGTLSGVKPKVSPNTNLPNIEILRRSQILKLVEAQPAKRYEALERFIDVTGVESSEEELDREIKTVNREIDALTKQRVDAEDRLNGLWNENGQPSGSWHEWAASKTDVSTEELGSTLSVLNSLITAIVDFNRRLIDYESSLASHESASSRLRSATAERIAQQASLTNQSPQLIETLQATEKLFANGWSEDSCPVCQQGIQSDQLRSRVAEALESMKLLKSVNDKEQSANREVNAALQGVVADKSKLFVSSKSLVQASANSTQSQIRNIGIDFTLLGETLDKSEITDEESRSAITKCKQVAALLESLEVVRNEKQRDKNQLHSIQTSAKTFTDAQNEFVSLDAIHKKLQQALAILRDFRIAFVQDILNSVSAEASRLYNEIHPNEDTKSGRLELDQSKRASLLQFAEFAGQPNIEPQGYFSDSHLDTLGFCYWFALAKRNEPKVKIIVLDDVFTSVDAAHLGRIIDLLDAECDQFAQVFIFTHNRNWFDRYRFNEAVAKKADKIELRRWTPTSGVRTDRTEPEIDEIIALAKVFSEDGGVARRQELASRCGILLEAFLGCVSKLYRGSVPHTPDGHYTLGDLLGSCSKIVKVLEIRRHAEPIDSSNENSCQKSNAQDAIGAVKALGAAIRNGVGCHFNQVAAQLSDSEVDAFANATIQFANAITCDHPDCGQIPQKNQGGHHQCNCKRTRFVLTKQP